MTDIARACAIQAARNIQSGLHLSAIELLREALRGTTNARAKSKLMLAIRELKRELH